MTLFRTLRNTVASLSHRQWQSAAIAVIIVAGTFAYADTLNVPFFMDDHDLRYYGRRTLSDILLHGGPRRVVDLTFALNYRLHGLLPVGYHLVNLAIHLSAAVTLFLLTSALLDALRHSCPPGTAPEAPGLRAERFIPLTAALLFTLHPIQTQAVTYIIQRYTSLATLCYLLSAYSFVQCRLAMLTGASGRRTLGTALAAATAGLLAIGSKQIAFTLPLMLITIEAIVFRGRLLNRRFMLGCAATALLALAAGAIHWRGNTLNEILLDLHHATAEDPHMSRTTYFLTQAVVIASYLRLLVLPYGQSIIHEPAVYRSLFTMPVVSSLVLHLGLVITALLLARRSGRTASPSDVLTWTTSRLAAFGIFWFYLALSVESSFFPIRDLMFEHRLYLPAAGFFIAVSAGAAVLFRRFGDGSSAAYLLVATLCILLGGMTLARNRLWNSDLELWQDAVKKTPHSALATANLGGAYLNRNMPEKTLPLLIRALELKPTLDANAKICLGRTLQALGVDGKRFTTGEEFVQPGTVMTIGGPGYGTLTEWESVLMNNMALGYEYLGQLDKAAETAAIAVWLRPDYDKGWYNAGVIALKRGDRYGAGGALEKLKGLNPSLARDLAAAMQG